MEKGKCRKVCLEVGEVGEGSGECECVREIEGVGMLGRFWECTIGLCSLEGREWGFVCGLKGG